MLGNNLKKFKKIFRVLLLLAAYLAILFPPQDSFAQFGLGAFWKKYVAAGGGPPNPTGLGATPAEFSIALAWTTGGGTTTGFKVVWNATGTAPTTCAAISEMVDTGATASATISGLNAGTQYSFRVCAYDSGGNLSSGVPVTSTTTSTDRFIFTTDATYKGNVIPSCSALATTAGLPNAANYVAFLQTSGNANNISNVIGGLKLPLKNRRPAGSGGPQIVMNSSVRTTLLASIGYSQTDAAVAGNAWTGMNTNGSGFNPATQCSGWTSAAGGSTGHIGLPTDIASATWFSTGTATCGTATRVICVDKTNGTVGPPDPYGATFTATSGTTGTLAWTVPSLEIGSTLWVINLSTTGIPANCENASDFYGSSTGTSVNVTGLTAGATYHARLCSQDLDDSFRSGGRVLTFTMPLSTIMWISSLTTSGVSSTGFTANASFTGDSDNDYGATLYYCNTRINASCDPQGTGTGYGSATMTKSGGTITAPISGLAPTTWEEYDVLNIRVVASDPDGINGSPLNGTVTLINVIQPPTTFTQLVKVKSSDGSGNYPYTVTITADQDYLGKSIAKVGRVLIAGVANDDNSVNTLSNTVDASNTQVDSGAIFIMRDTSGGGNWSTYVIDKYIKGQTISTNHLFGQMVAFDGTTLAIAAPKQSLTAEGYVEIYRELSANGNWSDATYKDIINNPHTYLTSMDCFGCAMAISGRNLFIGDHLEDGKDETAGSEVATLLLESGAVSVYYDATGDGSGYPATTPDKKLKQRNNANALDVVQKGFFGKSVSYSGSTLAVGAPGATGFSIAGKAFVYTCTVTAGGAPCGPTINWAAGTNTITAKVLTTTTPFNVPDTTLVENFYGQSVSIDDDTVVVGAPSDNTPNETNNTGTTITNAGAAYVWHSTNGNANWSAYSMVKKLKMRDSGGTVAPITGYYFGVSVAVMGPVVAVGAPRLSTKNLVNVFKDGDGNANFNDGTLNHHQRIEWPTAGTATDKFGENLVLDNSQGYFHLVISSHEDHSESPTADTNPISGVRGYRSGSIFIYGP